MLSDLLAIVTIAAFILIHGCAPEQTSRKPTGESRIGAPLEESYSAFTGTAGTAFLDNEAVYIDDKNRSVTVFQVEPFAVVSRLDLPGSVDGQAFFAGRNNAFFVLKESRGFGVMKRDGQYVKNPVPMFGKLTSASYDAAGQRLVLQDDLDSVALVAFDDVGNVARSWIGGPMLDGENAIIAGNLLENGTLLVSLSNQQMATVDFEASIANGRWEFSAFDLPIPGELIWLSPVYALEPVVIARTAKSIFTFDVQQQKVIDMITLADGETALHFNRSVGHVIISQHGQKHVLVHADQSGKLLRKTIHNAPVSASVDRSVEFSVLDQSGGSLTVMAGVDRQPSIYRNRLADGLFVGVVPVAGFGRTIITSSFVIEVLDYRLGKAVRKGIGNPEDRSEVTGFNVLPDL
jgi:hypothetical protein